MEQSLLMQPLHLPRVPGFFLAVILKFDPEGDKLEVLGLVVGVVFGEGGSDSEGGDLGRTWYSGEALT